MGARHLGNGDPFKAETYIDSCFKSTVDTEALDSATKTGKHSGDRHGGSHDPADFDSRVLSRVSVVTAAANFETICGSLKYQPASPCYNDRLERTYGAGGECGGISLRNQFTGSQ